MQAIAVQSNQRVRYHRPVSLERTNQSKIIKEIAFKALGELAVSLCIGYAVSFFVAPVAIGYIFSTILVQSLGSFAIRCVQAYFLPRVSQGPKSLLMWLTELRAGLFAQSSGHYAQTLIHEGGHALGSYLVYQDPKPEIQINPGSGGMTSFSGEKLTKFGKYLGANRSLALVTAAGAALTLLVSSIVLWIGIKLKKTHTETNLYLATYAMSDFTQHAYYAISALWASADIVSHDFVRLRAFGLHPLIAAVGIIAIPLLIASCIKKTARS